MFLNLNKYIKKKIYLLLFKSYYIFFQIIFLDIWTKDNFNYII